MLEMGMSMSLERLVIDNDIIGMFWFAKNGIQVDEANLDYESIREVGIGNNFLGLRETMMNRYRGSCTRQGLGDPAGTDQFAHYRGTGQGIGRFGGEACEGTLL